MKQVVINGKTFLAMPELKWRDCHGCVFEPNQSDRNYAPCPHSVEHRCLTQAHIFVRDLESYQVAKVTLALSPQLTGKLKMENSQTTQTTQTTQVTETKKLTGFAAMTPERQREIARAGQAALKASGKRHTWNSESAKQAAVKSWARRRGELGA